MYIIYCYINCTKKIFNCLFIYLCSRLRVDYRSLSEALTDLDEADEIKRKADKLQKAINSLQNTVDKIQAPNMRVNTVIIGGLVI